MCLLCRGGLSFSAAAKNLLNIWLRSSKRNNRNKPLHPKQRCNQGTCLISWTTDTEDSKPGGAYGTDREDDNSNDRMLQPDFTDTPKSTDLVELCLSERCSSNSLTTTCDVDVWAVTPAPLTLYRGAPCWDKLQWRTTEIWQRARLQHNTGTSDYFQGETNGGSVGRLS